MKFPIYLDNNSTTPVDARVMDVMLEYFSSNYGNYSNRSNDHGRSAVEAVDIARGQISTLVNCEADEVIFTSGATESNNTVLKGVAGATKNKKHIITSSIEHSSVLDTCRYLEYQGYNVSYLPVDKWGFVRAQDLTDTIQEDTFLISIMLANNEIGTIQPVEELGEIAKNAGIIFHSDASQALGKVQIDLNRLKVDFMSFSGHKIYGPKGIGALFVRKKTPKLKIVPLLHGGSQEMGLRSGTLNVPGIIGFGMACKIIFEGMNMEIENITKLTRLLLEKLKINVPNMKINGSMDKRIPGNLNVLFKDISSETLLDAIRSKLSVSTGSACSSASLEPSHVLTAIGLESQDAKSSVRFSVGRYNTEEQIDFAVQFISKVILGI